MPATELSPLRLAIVAEARSWLGTPFRHQGRIRGAGVDCAGLVIGVARALGLSEFDATGYGRLPNGHAIRRLCDAHLRSSPHDDAEPGDVLLMAWRRHPQHLAIVVDHPQGLGIVHGYERAGRVSSTGSTRSGGSGFAPQERAVSLAPLGNRLGRGCARTSPHDVRLRARW